MDTPALGSGTFYHCRLTSTSSSDLSDTSVAFLVSAFANRNSTYSGPTSQINLLGESKGSFGMNENTSFVLTMNTGDVKGGLGSSHHFELIFWSPG